MIEYKNVIVMKIFGKRLLFKTIVIIQIKMLFIFIVLVAEKILELKIWRRA